MRNTFLLLLTLIILAVITNAQSGRRGMPPPPSTPPVQLTELPLETRPAAERVPDASTPLVRKPVARPPLTTLPDNVLQRQLQSLDDTWFSLGDFSGKVIVVNIWATWCGPCRSEVPEYEKVRQRFAGKAVEFIGLTTEDPESDGPRVRKFVNDFHFGFRLAWADGAVASVLMNGERAIPQTLVIGKDGRVISHWSGYSRSQGGRHLREVVESALGER